MSNRQLHDGLLRAEPGLRGGEDPPLGPEQVQPRLHQDRLLHEVGRGGHGGGEEVRGGIPEGAQDGGRVHLG